jgi:hypothetical protein
MLELFFISSETVHVKFIPEEVIANKLCYKEVLCCLCSLYCYKHPELWSRKNWLLLRDDAPVHHSVPVQEELTK